MKPRIGFLRYSQYPGDPRLENQVEALVEAGYDVDVLCLQEPGKPPREFVNGTQIYRLPALDRKRGGKVRYLLEYISFLGVVTVFLAAMQLKRKYRLIQSNNLPDFLVFAAIVPKLLGVKIVQDFRESTPEQYHIKYGRAMDSRFIKTLIFIEQLSIKFSTAALTCTEQMKEAFVSRGANPDKFYVMLNATRPRMLQQELSLPDPNKKPDGTFRIVMHGTITERYGHDTLIRAMPYVLDEIPNAQLEIMGRGERRPELEKMVKERQIENHVTFSGFLPLDEVIRRIQLADCGVVSMPQNIETDLIHTNKMQEYITLGIPVAISRTKSVAAYYDDTTMCFFEASNEHDLAKVLVDLYQNPQHQHNLAVNGLKAYERYSSPKQRIYFAKMVNYLLGEASDAGDYEYLLQSDNQPAR